MENRLNKRKVLIVGPTQKTPKRANALIVSEVLKSLSNQNWDITYLDVNHGNEDFVFECDRVNLIKVNNSETKTKSILKKALMFFEKIIMFPESDKNLKSKLYEKIDELYNSNKFDNIICFSKPLLSISTVSKINTEHSTHRLAIFLDVLIGGDYHRLIPKWYINFKLRHYQKKYLAEFNQIMFPINSLKHYENHKFNFLDGKISYYEFPGYVKRNQKTSEGKLQKDGKTTIVYAGTLNKKYRNPDKILKCLSDSATESNPIEVILMGSSNCTNILNKYISSNFKVSYLGLVSKEVVETNYDNADFILNISNKDLDMIPSKIFEIFSYGKPILNFYFNEEDPSLKYFEKYPNSYNHLCDLSEIEHLKEFLKKNKGLIIDSNIIDYLYSNNSIDYFVSNIIGRMNEN